jgi:activator of 2-hydroxyglutaryl-CoA dehydratase
MKTARDKGTEGMIIFSHEHCQMLCPRLSLLETISNRNEMDVVTVSGDCILGMPPGPANIRLGTFFSSLKGKKTDADEIIQTRNTDEEVMNTLGGVRLGVDFGSGYSKFVLLDPEQNVLDKGLLNSGIDYPSLLSEIQERIPEHSDYKVGVSGVGGDNPMFQDIAHSQTTEINALMNTVRNLFPAKKNFLVIDIGTQDVKILLFKNMQSVPWVNTNKSCGAGTGLVLAQILERWRQSKPEMTFQQLDQMASEVQNGEVINTTCGIFAVTSVVSALVQSDENRRKRILRGVYQYIATQALKLLPADFRAGGELFLTGGIASHQTLRDIFTSKGFHLVDLPDNLHPQFLVAYGTALSIG